MDYTSAIHLDPLLTQAYTNRGNVYFKLKDYRKAIQDYTKAIQLDPGQSTLYYNRGLAHHYIKDTNACKDLEKALELGYKAAQKPLDSFCR